MSCPLIFIYVSWLALLLVLASLQLSTGCDEQSSALRLGWLCENWAFRVGHILWSSDFGDLKLGCRSLLYRWVPFLCLFPHVGSRQFGSTTLLG